MFLARRDNISDIFTEEHHLIKKHQVYRLEKLNSRELYHMQIILKEEKSNAQICYGKLECSNLWMFN